MNYEPWIVDRGSWIVDRGSSFNRIMFLRHLKDQSSHKRPSSRARRVLSNWSRAIGFGFGTACIAFLIGFVFFLNEIHSAARFPTAHVDTIVVFSGEPHRILVATDLLKDGFGQRLFIVGQDNRNEINTMRSKNQALFDCCVEIDSRSRNTAEDAILARNFILKTRSQSLILVTTSFHIPRAKKELQRLLPEIRITSYGISAGFYELGNIFHDPNVGPAFLSQYLKFVAVSLPGRGMLDKETRQGIIRVTSDVKKLLLLIVAVGALTVAAFAFFKCLVPPSRGTGRS